MYAGLPRRVTQRSTVLCEGQLAAHLPGKQAGQGSVGFNISGVKADRDLQFLFGILVLALVGQQNTQIAAEDSVTRSERAGFPHLGNGLVGASGSTQGRRQVAREARIVGAPLSGSLKHLHGLGMSPFSH